MKDKLSGYYVDTSYTKVMLPGHCSKKEREAVNDAVMTSLSPNSMILLEVMDTVGFLKTSEGNIKKTLYSPMTILHGEDEADQVEAFFVNIAYKYKWGEIILIRPNGIRIIKWLEEEEKEMKGETDHVTLN